MSPSPFAHLPPMTDDEVAGIRTRAMAVPISSALGFSLVSLERGVCRLAMARNPKFDGIYRSLHGGLMMTLADSAGAFAWWSRRGCSRPGRRSARWWPSCTTTAGDSSPTPG